MIKAEYKDIFCNNCGKTGHGQYQCKHPITSVGIIAFRYNNETLEYLMIRRKDTLGYVDFMRGKFSVHQKTAIMNMIKQMTIQEKNTLIALYHSVRVRQSAPYPKEKIHQLIKGVTVEDEYYDLLSLIEESQKMETFLEPEWGFPKGRRNHLENDYDCAMREFSEETGFSPDILYNIRNIVPYEEIFIGSNCIPYRHKYYLMYMEFNCLLECKSFQKSEVSGMEWKAYETCLESIRPYNLEKKKMIEKVNKCLRTLRLCHVTQK